MASVGARSIFVVFAVLVAMLQSHSAARAADKVALVIGNAKYSQLGTLNNTVNDATAISQALAKMGFESQLVTDADGSALRNAIKSFTQRSAGKSVAVVFYAGHGVQVAGDNYLLPVDFDVPRSESDIRISGIKVDDLLAAIQSKVKVVFLDACRDNPVLARTLLTATRGLAPQGLPALSSSGPSLSFAARSVRSLNSADTTSISARVSGKSSGMRTSTRRLLWPLSLAAVLVFCARAGG